MVRHCSGGDCYDDGLPDYQPTVQQTTAPPPPPPPPPCLSVGDHDFGGNLDGAINSTCCPGLTKDISGGYDNPVILTCSCPTNCIPVGQAIPQIPGCTLSCCPGASVVNGTCQYPPGYHPPISGTFVSGPLPVATGTGGCSGSPGWAVGKQSDCGQVYVFPNYRHEWRAYYVDSPNPKPSLCPQIGNLTKAQWVDDNNQTGFATGEGGIGSRIRLQCVYSGITNPFDQQVLNTFTGTGATPLTGVGQLQNQYCDTKMYNDVKTGPCSTFYTSVTKDYDYQQVKRINEENPNGAWISNSEYLQIVQQVATGTAIVASSLGKQYAQNMIANYCLVQNPTGWADNDTIRAIINSWALQNAANIGDDCQLLASGIVSHFCQTNPTSSHCDCYNATQFGTNIFNACQGKTIGACTDINKLAASMAQAPSIFSAQIATLKSYITPNCAVGACVSAATSTVSTYLVPSPLTQLACKSDISLCLESVKVGGSLLPGATINQNCSQTIGLPGNVPSQPSSNQGFQNAQAVQANANAPGGGTTAAVLSPSGSSTTVSTTGTPSGGLSQTITSNQPTTAVSSGPAPVTQGPAVQGPAAQGPASSPASTSTQNIQITDQQKAAAAGIAGISSFLSFFCFIGFCILIVVLLSRGDSKPAKPMAVPLSAVGI